MGLLSILLEDSYCGFAPEKNSMGVNKPVLNCSCFLFCRVEELSDSAEAPAAPTASHGDMGAKPSTIAFALYSWSPWRDLVFRHHLCWCPLNTLRQPFESGPINKTVHTFHTLDGFVCFFPGCFNNLRW